MTNTAAITSDWRKIGDTELTVYEAEFRRVNSPMISAARETFEAASPHSALFLAQAWLENKYETTGHIIKPHHHNPVSIRPPAVNKPGPFAVGVITAPDGGQFERYASDADCAREWQRRLVTEAATYKGGVYARTTTLAEMLNVYAPSGDVHPVTGLDNEDIGYAGTVTTMLRRYAQAERNAPIQPDDEEGPVMDNALPLTQKMIPKGNRNYPQAMLNENTPLWITIHETGNTKVGADALMHANFCCNGGGTSTVSFHLVVDRAGAYQMLKLDRIGWHASDGCNDRGSDLGCFASIAIETCVDNNNAHKVETRANLIRLIGMILTGHPSLDFGGVDYRRFSVDRIATHHQWAFDGKWCPTYMLNEGYVDRIPTLVKAVLGAAPKPDPDPAPEYPPAMEIPQLDVLARGDVNQIPATVLFDEDRYVAIWVGDRVRAIRNTPRMRFLDGQADRIGPDIESGEEFDVDWIIMKPSEPGFTPKYRSPWGTIVNVADTGRVGEVKAA